MEDREGEPSNTSALTDQLSVIYCMWFHQNVGHDENVYLPYPLSTNKRGYS